MCAWVAQIVTKICIQNATHTIPSLLTPQLPRYKSLKAQLVKVIEHLVGSAVSEGASNEMGKLLQCLICHYHTHIQYVFI